MSERRNPNIVSIQIKIPQRSALLRSAFIGSALLMILAPMFTYNHIPPIIASLNTLAGGLAAGAFTAFAAWVGQIVARSGSEGQGINRRAVWYTSLVSFWLWIALMATVYVSNGISSYVGGIVITSAAAIVGGLMAVGISAAFAATALLLNRQAAPQMQMQVLGEGQFDPLQQPQHIRDQARR